MVVVPSDSVYITGPPPWLGFPYIRRKVSCIDRLPYDLEKRSCGEKQIDSISIFHKKGSKKTDPKTGPCFDPILDPPNDVHPLWVDIVWGACFGSKNGPRFGAAPLGGSSIGCVSWSQHLRAPLCVSLPRMAVSVRSHRSPFPDGGGCGFWLCRRQQVVAGIGFRGQGWRLQVSWLVQVLEELGCGRLRMRWW